MGRVEINPKALKWARIDAGYDYSNLPNNIKTKFKDWESGKTMPTWNQLCEISNHFKRPSAFFFRRTFPENFDLDLIEYRKLDNKEYQFKTPNLILGLRSAVQKRDNFLNLIDELHYPKISFSNFKFNSKDAVDLSNHIRNILNVDLEEQKSWLYKNGRKDTNHYNFINHWKDKIANNLGILIFEIPRISLDEMRALCIYYDMYPIIILNSADSPNARIFSLIHELTHLILGESAICDAEENNAKEWLCNSVAAEFLIPKKDLLNNSIVRLNNGKWTDKELSDLSNEYGVSKQALLLRLVHLNMASNKSYEEMCKQWDYYSVNKRYGGGSPVLNQLKYNGKLYSSILFSAYENGILSDVEFSQDIGLRLKHIDELYDRLFG